MEDGQRKLWPKEKTTVYKTLHRKLNVEQHKNQG
jgi:hypothetical protein